MSRRVCINCGAGDQYGEVNPCPNCRAPQPPVATPPTATPDTGEAPSEFEDAIQYGLDNRTRRRPAAPTTPPPTATLEEPTHKWDLCAMCGPMVLCGHCGNNCCNGGSGDNCPDKCKSAHALMTANDPTTTDLKAMLSKARRCWGEDAEMLAAVRRTLDLEWDADTNAAVSEITRLRSDVERATQYAEISDAALKEAGQIHAEVQALNAALKAEVERLTADYERFERSAHKELADRDRALIELQAERDALRNLVGEHHNIGDIVRNYEQGLGSCVTCSLTPERLALLRGSDQ